MKDEKRSQRDHRVGLPTAAPGARQELEADGLLATLRTQLSLHDFVVRTQGPSDNLAGPAREVIHALDPQAADQGTPTRWRISCRHR